MTQPESQPQPEQPEKEKSFFQIIIHSFFVIPFLIAVFCLLLFTAINLLTQEKRTAYDYLEDVKVGGSTKRWQGAYFLSKIHDNKRFRGAFELSKMLSQPGGLPNDERFINELLSAFEKSKHDDDRVRQYLALAIGRTGRSEFLKPLLTALEDERKENLWALLYAVGMLKQKEANKTLYKYLEHSDARIRSIVVVSIGNIGDLESVNYLKKMLNDSEANVQWGSAISLAQLGDISGKEILTKLLDRSYLEKFIEVDEQEQTYLMESAIQAAGRLNDTELLASVKELSQKDKSMKVRAAAFDILKDIQSK